MDSANVETSAPPAARHEWVLLDMLAQFSWRAIVCAIALTLGVFVVIQLSFVVIPVFLAILFTSILNPLAAWLQRRGMPAGTSATVTIVIVILAIVIVLLLVVPPIVSNADEFVKALGEAIDRLVERLQDSPFNMSAEDASDIGEKLSSYGPQLKETLVSGVGTILPVVAQMLVTLGLSIVMTGYLLRDGLNNWNWALGFVDEPRRPALNKLGKEAYGTLSAYIRGTSIVAAFNSVAITGGAALFGLPLLLPIALIIFIAGFLPIVGAWMAAGATIAIGLSSGGLGAAIGIGLTFLFVSMIKSYFLAPFIVGNRVKLAPIITLTVVMVGTVLGGIVGGIVAVPLLASVSGVLGQMRRWRVEGKGELLPVLPAA